MAKISACLIVRDEESTLRACLESIRPHVDELIVVDTGSTDGSPAIARALADKWELFLDCNDAEGRIADFARARNRALELARHEWHFWADGDDVVTGAENLRAMADEHGKVADNVVVLCPYEYAYDAQGRCTILQQRERLVRPAHRFEWRSPIHEVLVARSPTQGTFATVQDDRLRVEHRIGESRKPREPGRNLRILEKYVRDSGGGDPRSLFYLGIELAMANRPGEAIGALRRYVNVSGWHDERCLALLKLGELYAIMGDLDSAEHYATEAMKARGWPSPYFLLGRIFYVRAQRMEEPEYNYRRAAHFIQIGLNLETDTVLFVNPVERFEIQYYLQAALHFLGDIDGALRACEAGLTGMPEHTELAKNRDVFRAALGKRRVMSEVKALRDVGGLDEPGEIIIREVLNGNFEVKVANDGAPKTAVASPAPSLSGTPDVAFFVGEGLEPWNPETLAAGGMGGSETMAWEMAKRLAARGNRVRVYGHCLPSQEGTFEGVEWIDWHRFRDAQCGVLISSRVPEVVDQQWNVQADARVLWLHDIHCGERLTHKRELRFDEIWALSGWHKSTLTKCYPKINPDKIRVTRNGIDLTWFDTLCQPRNPHGAVYASSPDRGLLTLLECWPEIRRRVPDAELAVFYGFLNWRRAAEAANDQDGLRLIRHLEHRVKHTEGVAFFDRVSGRQLAGHLVRSGVLAYPTWWSETSCIVAMQAQAAGMHVVTSPIAALNETVGDRGVMIEGDAGAPGTVASKEYCDRFVSAVVAAMNEPSANARAIEYASRHFGLEELADEWHVILADLRERVSRDVVPRFFDMEIAS